MTACKKGRARHCYDDRYQIQLIADCSTDPVGSSGAVHTLTIDSYRGSKTLWGTNAKVTIPDPDPQVGIEFDETGPARPP
jgi:hypothetical protein